MNKKWIACCSVMALVCLALVTSGCKGSEESPFQAMGRLLRSEGCKSFPQGATVSLAVASDQDCLEYRCDGSTLRMKHINACFNCCPGEIGADIRVDGWVITIQESEATALCFCLCLFDLEMEIENLPPGQYSIQVVNPYVDSGDEPLAFTAQLAPGASGRFCVERDKYPWYVPSNE
ncbi:MAG: hypothetical protein JXO51_04575 [Candidatus Aminicenantes bacterium]|nr:hypothetical protein [Candidatus Aminicenantes bacterium]